MSRKSTILDTLSKEDIKLFDLVTLNRNQILFHEDDPCHQVGIVKTGSLIISSYTFEGKEIVFNTINEGDMFANNLVFSSDPSFKGNVIATSKTQVYLIERDDLLTLCSKNKAFLKSYLTIQSNNTINLNTRVKLLSFSSLKERLTYALFVNDNRLPFKSISALAKELNAERETLSRLLTKMESQNEIKRIGHVIVKELKTI